MRSRAYRRHHKQRIKAKAKRVFEINLGPNIAFVHDCGKYRSQLARWIKTADYLAVCSCDQCGNPRFGNSFNDKTLQERKFLQG